MIMPMLCIWSFLKVSRYLLPWGKMPNIQMQKTGKGVTGQSNEFLSTSDLERWDGMDLSQIIPWIMEKVAYMTTSIHDMKSSSLPEVYGEASDHIIGPGQGKCQQAEVSDCRGLYPKHMA
jgi:hypothetical protein